MSVVWKQMDAVLIFPSHLSPGRRGGARGGRQPGGVRGGLRGRGADQRTRPVGTLARRHSARCRCQQDGPGQTQLHSTDTQWGSMCD